MNEPHHHDPPRISAIIPLYNAGTLIDEALDSISAQTWPVHEVIVVNDGSTDDSPARAERHSGVRLFHQKNQGVARALNHGIGQSSGDYLAFLDADDRWLPEKCALQIAALREDPQRTLVFGQCRRFLSRDVDGRRHESVLDVVPGLSKTCMMAKRAAFDRAGLFPEETKTHDFLGWMARAREAGLNEYIVTAIVAERRIHEHNHGIVRKSQQRETYFQSLKTMLDRRRGSTP